MLGIYTSSAFSTASGLALAPGATIEVRRESDGALASLFADAAGTVTKSNPFTAHAVTGAFSFFAAGLPDGYEVKSTFGAEVATVEHQPVGRARYYDTDAVLRAAMGFPSSVVGKFLVGDGSNFLGSYVQAGYSILNGYLEWSVSGNALTVAVKNFAGATPSAADPVYVIFRSATAAFGNLIVRALTGDVSITINNTATLGTANGIPFRLWAVLFDDAGNVRIGLINCLIAGASGSSIYPLAGWGIASSLLEDDTSDAAHVFYSGAAVTSKPYATAGYATWESGLATAGAWSAAPTRQQLFGAGVPLPGQTVQLARTDTGAAASGSTQIPYDDTIPQNTEGTEFMTRAITPSSAANLLRVSAQALLRQSAANVPVTVALFKDAIANALAATPRIIDTANEHQTPMPIDHALLAGSTATITFKLRAGGSGASTVYFNANSAGGRYMGGVANSFMQAEEVMA